MITEFAEIEIKPGMEQQFIAAVAENLSVFDRAPGCHGMLLQRSVEHPQHFIVVVKWDSVADHTEKFQKSPDYHAWRGKVGPCFAGPPKVWHTETVAGR